MKRDLSQLRSVDISKIYNLNKIKRISFHTILHLNVRLKDDLYS